MEILISESSYFVGHLLFYGDIDNSELYVYLISLIIMKIFISENILFYQVNLVNINIDFL